MTPFSTINQVPIFVTGFIEIYGNLNVCIQDGAMKHNLQNNFCLSRQENVDTAVTEDCSILVNAAKLSPMLFSFGCFLNI